MREQLLIQSTGTRALYLDNVANYRILFVPDREYHIQESDGVIWSYVERNIKDFDTALKYIRSYTH